jgi:hypothetical protein
MPTTSSNDRLAVAIKEITHIVKHTPYPAEPFLHNGEPTNAMVTQLCEIFATATPQTPQLPTTNRGVPRVQDTVTETVTAPRVVATPTGTGAATPRVGTTPATTAPATPRVPEPNEAPKALRRNMQEGPYWTNSSKRSRTKANDKAKAIRAITRRQNTNHRELANHANHIQYHHKNHYANAITDKTTGKQLEYCHLLKHPQYQ